MKEVWKDVAGHKGYQISNIGRVRSNLRSKSGEFRLLKLSKNAQGYMTLRLHGKSWRVHRLVMSAFVGASEMMVNHIDGNPSNNNISNLEYVTRRENINHGKKGKYLKGCYKNSANTYFAYISVNKKRKILGNFKSQEEAHAAYLLAAKLIGEQKYAESSKPCATRC